ncbi:MAG: DUF459 domain-containing protein [Deltaproteobacteria bacterium]|nr:DUF459 domain-containing protein [Deltaproteobacteria bacterium]MCB9787844.1 DUF459 domain-containing protein [Deltaproteobacteria bacterium]
MMRRRLLFVTLSLALSWGPAAAAGQVDKCPRVSGKPKVYLMGSSTMGSLLGPILQSLLDKEWGLEARRWGKASSGLARPDFHDWPGLLPGLMVKHRPDIVVISLGTNDNQPLWVRKGVWIRLDNPKWETTYAERVRETLSLAAGKSRRRLVVWMGPTAFEGKIARHQGPIINRIIAREVEAFDGKAIFVDSYAATTDAKGHPIRTFKAPGSKKAQPAYGEDGIHLTSEAVRWLLAEPVRKLIGACATASEEVAAAEEAEEAAADDDVPPEDAPPLADGTAATDDDPGAAADESDEPTPAPETDEEEAQGETADAPEATPAGAPAPLPDAAGNRPPEAPSRQ